MLILITIFPGSMVNSSEATKSSESAVYSRLGTGSSVDAATIALSPDTILRSNPAGDALEAQAGKILKEVGKQTIDQAGHFLVGAAPIWASRYLVGVPWYGWVVAPLLAYREWLQWPSNRWWDPPLDWAFLSLGLIVATWPGRPPQRVVEGLASLRRRLAPELPLRIARRGSAKPHLVRAHATSAGGAARGPGSLSAAAKAGSRR
jgi:hypothetical protein